MTEETLVNIMIGFDIGAIIAIALTIVIMIFILKIDL